MNNFQSYVYCNFPEKERKYDTFESEGERERERLQKAARQKFEVLGCYSGDLVATPSSMALVQNNLQLAEGRHLVFLRMKL